MMDDEHDSTQLNHALVRCSHFPDITTDPLNAGSRAIVDIETASSHSHVLPETNSDAVWINRKGCMKKPRAMPGL
jgi:hypothetical protein